MIIVNYIEYVIKYGNRRCKRESFHFGVRYFVLQFIDLCRGGKDARAEQTSCSETL